MKADIVAFTVSVAMESRSPALSLVPAPLPQTVEGELWAVMPMEPKVQCPIQLMGL